MSALAERLAGFVAGFDGSNVSEKVREQALRCVIDFFGAAVAGSASEPAGAVRRVRKRLGGPAEATIIGEGGRASVPVAALANGTAAHCLELDDTHSPSFLHAGAVVIPAALAVAEEVEASGREFLDAVIVGYETAIHIAAAMNPEHRFRGFHTTATVGTFGAAAAAGRLLELKPWALAQALGIAGSDASGLFEFLRNGENIKRMHPGKAAFDGILSVYMQQEGIEGPVTIFEGEHGVYRSMADHTHAVGEEEPGLRFRILEVSFKPYPTCRFCHASMDAALELHDRIGSVDDGAKITVEVSELCAKQTGNAAPQSVLGRQFSTPYSVALGLLHGQYGLSHYLEIPDQRALRVARDVLVRVNDRIPADSRRAVLTVEFDGRRHEATIETPSGEPPNPMSEQRIEEKFLNVSGSVLGRVRAQGILETLKDMDTGVPVRIVTEKISQVCLQAAGTPRTTEVLWSR